MRPSEIRDQTVRRWMDHNECALTNKETPELSRSVGATSKARSWYLDLAQNTRSRKQRAFLNMFPNGLVLCLGLEAKNWFFFMKMCNVSSVPKVGLVLGNPNIYLRKLNIITCKLKGNAMPHRVYIVLTRSGAGQFYSKNVYFWDYLDLSGFAASGTKLDEWVTVIG